MRLLVHLLAEAVAPLVVDVAARRVRFARLPAGDLRLAEAAALARAHRAVRVEVALGAPRAARLEGQVVVVDGLALEVGVDRALVADRHARLGKLAARALAPADVVVDGLAPGLALGGGRVFFEEGAHEVGRRRR